MTMWQSRKFRLLLLDALLALILFFAGKYAGAAFDDIKFVVGLMQPVFVVIIGGIALEDAAAKHNGNFSPPPQPRA